MGPPYGVEERIGPSRALPLAHSVGSGADKHIEGG
jgi:hypothetical protein